jgi:chemotaxis protein histidine kinase CheA
MTDPVLDGALHRIWTRARPKLVARVDAIDRAIAALDADADAADPDVIDSGRDAAHKISGLAGTFDLDEATRLARSLEHALEDRGHADPRELRRMSSTLRSVLEG